MLLKKLKKKADCFLIRNNRGISTVEIVLIIVVLVGLVILFKGQITSVVNNILNKITNQSNSI